MQNLKNGASHSSFHDMLSWRACFLLPPCPLLKAYQFLLVAIARRLHTVSELPAWNMDKHYLRIGHPYFYTDHKKTFHHCPFVFSPQSSRFDSNWQQHPSHDTVSIIRASQGSTESLGTAGHFRKTPWMTANLEISLSKKSWIKLGLFCLDKPQSLYK